MGKNLPANARDIRDAVLSLGREDPLEEGMATHSSVLAWRIPWTEEPGGPQSWGHKQSVMTKAKLAFIYVYTHTYFFRLFPLIGYYEMLSKNPCIIQ